MRFLVVRLGLLLQVSHLLTLSFALQVSRRNAVASFASIAITMAAAATTTPSVAAASDDVAASSLAMYRSMILQATQQLDPAVPALIQKEQWDSIRAILITPPLSDLYKTKPTLLVDYAALVGDDELAVLEAREELQTHLRFLDMAVYNNVFNPIKSMGQNGATKQLVASYYEDPLREYKASLQALLDLYSLGDNK